MRQITRTGGYRPILAIAALAAITGATSLWAQIQVAVPVGGRAGRGAAPASQPADVGNTGRPEDPGMAPVPGAMMDQAAILGMQVYVDDSFASVDSLRNAIRLQRNGQAREAIAAYQKIIDDFGQKLVYLNDKSYVSITDYVRDRLLEMPAVKNGMYDQIYGNEAKKAIESASDDRDLSRLMRVSDRYFPSKSALTGMSQAAEWYFERGEFSAAAETWRKLLRHPLAASMQADLLFRAATAQSLAGGTDNASAMRARLAKDFSETTGMVGGKEIKLLSRLDEILAMPPWEKTALGSDEWPAFEGGPARNGLLSTNATIGARLWSVALKGASDPAQPSIVTSEMELRARLMAENGRVSVVTGDSTILPSHPVLSNGTLFVHAGNQILAVSANAGARLWSFPPPQAGDGTFRTSNLTSTGHDSVAVFGDQVFAMMPVSPTSPLQYDSTGTPAFATRLVCVGRDDGREIWSRLASEVKTDRDGQITFVGSPLVTRQGVYIMARKAANNNFSQQYLVRLDRETGQPSWSCYLCSTSLINNNQGNNVPIPTLVDDVLYVSTGQGADCAIDANVGRILWLRISARPRSGVSGFTPSWKFNPPVVVGDKMISVETNRGMRVYNRNSGKLLHEYVASDLLDSAGRQGGTTIDVLAGVVGNKVILSIGNVTAAFDESELEKDVPEPAWRGAVVGAGRPIGRPFLTDSGYYVPFDNRLVRFDIRTGKSEPWEWPPTEQGVPGKPGNLLVTTEQVIVVNDAEIAGYSKWETARDNRLAKISASPRDPLPYLALAEVSFRTGHHDMAKENMKKSVDLANEGAASPGQSAGDVPDRLYRTNLSFAEQLLAKNDNELRDMSRFYYEQCRASARKPEQQAEWRLRLAELSIKQKKYDEAVTLYSEILADPAVRTASYRDIDGLTSAGASAEQRIRPLRDKDVIYYKRYEDAAAARTQQASSQKDAAGLQQVIDVYPNSNASIDAAKNLIAVYIERQEWENARRVLFWLQPRVKDDAHARTLADLAKVNLGLKKLPSALAWASRGARLYKDFTWTEAGKKISFQEYRAQIGAAGGGDIEGRLPKWNGEIGPDGLDYVAKEKMEVAGKVIPLQDQKPLDERAQLLTPVETASSLRAPNLIFLRHDNYLRIYDTAKGEFVADRVTLPRSTTTVLMGVTKDTAILLQSDTLIGVDLKTKNTWSKELPLVNAAPPPAIATSTRTIRVANGTPVEIIDGILYLNGSPYADAASITVIDENGNPRFGRPLGDPESLRRTAISILGAQARVTSARLINGKVYLLAGNQLDAYNATDGKPAWVTREDRKLTIALPKGTPMGFVGNEDLIIVQVDSTPDGKSSAFYAYDSETGKEGRQVRMDNEHANWRGLGDDGTLYVVSNQAVTAYDMLSAQGGVLWRKNGVGSKFNAATALTLDGVVVITDTYEVQCLALESGETRWQETLHQEDNILKSGTSAASSMRSFVEGDLVIFQSTDGCVAYQSAKKMDRQLVWSVAKLDWLPARQSLAFFDRLVIEQMSGSVPGVSAKSIVLGGREVRGGKIAFNVSLSGRDSPSLRNWQLADNGIAMDVGTAPVGNNSTGTIYFIRNKVPEPKKDAP